VAYSSVDLDPSRTAMLLIDVYGKSVEEAGDEAAATPEFLRPSPRDPRPQLVRDRIAPAKLAARAAGIATTYVTNHLSDGLTAQSEWRNMTLRTCGIDVLDAWRPPTPSLDYSSVITPDALDVVIRKQHYSGFFETDLDSHLRALDVNTLILAGFDSRFCLAATATDAMYRNYRVVVLRDATHTFEYDDTEASQSANMLAIRYIESAVGYTSTSAEFIACCEGSSATGESEGPEARL
jgi:nicotinamidase-related amidase